MAARLPRRGLKLHGKRADPAGQAPLLHLAASNPGPSDSISAALHLALTLICRTGCCLHSAVPATQSLYTANLILYLYLLPQGGRGSVPAAAAIACKHKLLMVLLLASARLVSQLSVLCCSNCQVRPGVGCQSACPPASDTCTHNCCRCLSTEHFLLVAGC